MRYSQIKSIEAVMAEKKLLKSKIAKKEEYFSSIYNNTKAVFKSIGNCYNIAKAIILRKKKLSDYFSKFSLGVSIAKYVVNMFKH
jgi:hypothetical protein